MGPMTHFRRNPLTLATRGTGGGARHCRTVQQPGHARMAHRNAPIQPAALNCCTKRCTADAMVIGVRVEPELERQLDLLARQQGKTRSACIREAIRQYLLRHGDGQEARRQSEHLAQLEQPHWSEQVPDWSDWTA